MSRRRPTPRGFTMVEAMIASTILMIALAALLPLQVMGARMNRWSERTLDATFLATDLSENIARWSYSDTRLDPLATVASSQRLDRHRHLGHGQLGPSLGEGRVLGLARCPIRTPRPTPRWARPTRACPPT